MLRILYWRHFWAFFGQLCVFLFKHHAEVSPHLSVVGNRDTEYTGEHGENPVRTGRIRAVPCNPCPNLSFRVFKKVSTVKCGLTPCGRQRFNVLGALNAITHELTTITNDAYITSVSVCALLEKIANRYQGIPISVFLDNARYQRCALVIEKAKSLNIELCFLPSYSPNLNLIERMWKFVKKKCLYSKYYEKFPAFKEAISKCLEETTTTHKSDLDSLLTLRFQLFQKPQFVTP